MRIRTFIFLLLILITRLEANSFCTGWEAEFRIAGFHSSSEKFRHIYSDWLVDYQLQVAKEICGPIALWGNVSWAWEDGHSLSGHHHTYVRVLPFSFGLEYNLYVTRCVALYGGLGASYASVYTDDSDAFIRDHHEKWNWGGVIKLGAKWSFLPCLFLDLFGDYYYQPYRFADEALLRDPVVITTNFHENLGGWRLGGGIGYSW